MGNKGAICTKLFRKRVSELDLSDNGFLNDKSLRNHMINCSACAKAYFNILDHQTLKNYLDLEKQRTLENEQALQNQPAQYHA